MKIIAYFGKNLLHGAEEGLEVGKVEGIWVEGLLVGSLMGKAAQNED